METQEKILKIDIKYDDAIRKIADYRTQLDAMRAGEKQLKEDLDNSKIGRAQYNMELSKSKLEQKQCSDAIRVLNKEVQNNIKAETEQKDSLTSLRASLSNLTKQYDQMSAAERKSASGQDLKLHINEVTAQSKEGEEGTDRF